MKALSKIVGILVILAALAICTTANAAISTYSGQVSGILVVGTGGGAPGNNDFRVYIQGASTQCNGATFSYINTNDANYQAVVASILTARSLGIPVNLYVAPDTITGCHILYIQF